MIFQEKMHDFRDNGVFSKRKCVILGLKRGVFQEKTHDFGVKSGIFQEKMHDFWDNGVFFGEKMLALGVNA